MADIIISFRSSNALFKSFIFTKELSRVAFDTTNHVIFNFESFELDETSFIDSCKTVTRHSQISLKPKHIYCTIINEIGEFCHQPERVRSICTNRGRIVNEDKIFLCVNPDKKCTLLMDAHLASCVAKYVCEDKIFRIGFWKYVKWIFGFMHVTEWTDGLGDCGYLNVSYSIDIVSVWPRQKVDFSWYGRIHYLVRKRCQLEENMAWLSTLGGGYSSLGDYFTYCAEKAGTISKQQLQLAVEMSDPIMASKCRVFWAQSLLQQGYLRPCKYIVRNEFKFATTNGIKDQKLENMCLSVWNRLKFLYKVRHSNGKKSHETCKSVLYKQLVTNFG